MNQPATNAPFSPHDTLEINSKQYTYRLISALMSLLPQKFPKMVGGAPILSSTVYEAWRNASGVD
jgi:hypothetical protein